MSNESAMSQIAPEILEAIVTNWNFLNPIEFSKFIYKLDLTDEIKREFISAKISQPPVEAGDSLHQAMERAVSDLWSRLQPSAQDAVR